MLADCSRLAARVYQPLQSNGWERFASRDEPWAWASLAVGPSRVVVIRGSISLDDWFEDIRSEDGVEDGRLGPIPQGFAFGLDASAANIGHADVIVGHSLGAGRETLLAGLFQYEGHGPKALVVMGCPRCGTSKLTGLIAKIPARWLFQNRLDPVHDVPIPILGQPWEHQVETTMLDVAPTGGGLLADHRVELYMEGVTRGTRARVVVAV